MSLHLFKTCFPPTANAMGILDCVNTSTGGDGLAELVAPGLRPHLYWCILLCIWHIRQIYNLLHQECCSAAREL